MRTCLRLLLALSLFVALTGTWLGSSRAASHREAPLMALDPAADITDVYAFRQLRRGELRPRRGRIVASRSS